MREPRIELLCVGTELLSGKVNTHAAYFSRRLGDLGLSLARETTLPDDADAIAEATAQALARSDAVLVAGGLGPTFDDVTREGVARALGRPLVFVPSLYRRIRSQFARTRTPLPASNRRQAFLLRGARVLRNARGSAPGQWMALGARERPRLLALLPGPFRELEPMAEDALLPRLRALYARGRASRCEVLRFCGLSESAADARLKSLWSPAPDWARYTILASPGLVELHVRALASSPAAAHRRLKRLRAAVLRRMAPYYYGSGETSLEEALGRRLRARGLSLAVAESCTGGLLGKRLSSVPGSSAYFLGGVVAYRDDVKRKALGVSAAVLREHGAVSSPCARAMALGAERLGADATLAVTGIAGPGGGSRRKPVGLVYIALSLRGKARVYRRFFSGEREHVREKAATEALTLLWRAI